MHRPSRQPVRKPPDLLDEACCLHDRAMSLDTQGKHAEAATSALRPLHLLERALGPDHPDIANVLNTLAGVCQHQDKYAEAERLLQ